MLRCRRRREAADARDQAAEEQQAAAEVGGFQVTFRIPGRVSVGASEGAKSLRVSTATIAPDLAVRAGAGAWIRPRSSKPASGRARTRRCCPAGSRSIATACSSAVA